VEEAIFKVRQDNRIVKHYLILNKGTDNEKHVSTFECIPKINITVL